MLSFASCSESESKTSENSQTDKITNTSADTPNENVNTPDNTVNTPDNTVNTPDEDTKVYAEAPGTRGEPDEEVSFDGITYDHNTDEVTEVGNAVININDKDVSDTCYVYINKEAKTAEFAITSIMKEIGATVTWNDERAIISKDNLTLVLDISLSDFGLPQTPDSSHYVRKVINGEIVLDRESANPFIRAAGYSLKINYNSGIINIVPLS